MADKISETFCVPSLDEVKAAMDMITKKKENPKEATEEELEKQEESIDEINDDLDKSLAEIEDDSTSTSIEIVLQDDEFNALLADNKQFEKEMDEIAEQANKAFGDLLELSFDVEARNASAIASAAKEFLNTRLNAKISKAKRKLDIIHMSLNARKIKGLEERAKLKADPTPVKSKKNEKTVPDGLIIISSEDRNNVIETKKH